ncbi:MAG: transporter substrate-binding domain-containing protein [Planctomycetes bacterium]|nr:transporter substrate-binding domain-containing protein [Planctomycetota bacterium]
MHPTLRRRLLALDLLDPQAIDAAKPLLRHLADFHQALLDQGRTRDYADLVRARVGHVIAGCRFKLLSDIRPSTAERYLADLRRGAAASPTDGEKRRRAISVQTAGHYVASLKAFCNWMVRDGRAAENPLASLRKQNPAADRRHVRRALAGDEAQRLLDATRDGPSRYGIDGPERAAIYWLALETGRVDAYATDDVLLYGLISKSKNPDQWQVTGRFLSYDPYGLMVPRNDSTYRRIGTILLADLMRSGEMLEIYNKWFNPGPTNINMPISDTLSTAFVIQALPH